MELFENASSKDQKRLQPLAERIRPKKIDLFLGNTNILNNVLKTKNISLIFWGPPGSGKTTLAKLLALHIEAEIFYESATIASVSDIRKILKIGEYNFLHLSKKTILFLDEIHHFNKSQQDVLLNSIEEGKILFIGATTENPSFKVNNALLSRCQVYQFDSLRSEDLKELIRRAIKEDEYYNKYSIKISDEALELLISLSNGDGRILLNLFETSFNQCRDNIITDEDVKNAVQKRSIFYDSKSEYHYDTISAFIKSVRGSDPDAALYYLAIMLEGGEDILFIARRLIVLASEDIGNANPMGIVLATSCFNACHSIGMPEARIVLAQTTTYLASSPKSNASYLGIENALSEIRKNGLKPIPMHLRNAPTKLMKELGYSKGYKYPHDYDNHFTKEDYLPAEVAHNSFYQPTEIGSESALKKHLRNLWKDRY